MAISLLRGDLPNFPTFKKYDGRTYLEMRLKNGGRIIAKEDIINKWNDAQRKIVLRIALAMSELQKDKVTEITGFKLFNAEFVINRKSITKKFAFTLSDVIFEWNDSVEDNYRYDEKSSFTPLSKNYILDQLKISTSFEEGVSPNFKFERRTIVEPKPYTSPSRAGKRALTIHVESEVAEHFKQVCEELNLSREYLGYEAISLVLAKYNKPIPPILRERLGRITNNPPGPKPKRGWGHGE